MIRRLHDQKAPADAGAFFVRKFFRKNDQPGRHSGEIRVQAAPLFMV